MSLELVKKHFGATKRQKLMDLLEKANQGRDRLELSEILKLEREGVVSLHVVAVGEEEAPTLEIVLEKGG